MKKGFTLIIIPLATIVFLASVIIILMTFFNVAGYPNIIQQKRIISGDSEKSGYFIMVSNQASFLESEWDNKKVSRLIVDAVNGKDNDALKSLELASADYLKIYNRRCVLLEALDKNRNALWNAKPSEGCRLTGLVALINPAFTTEVIIPADDPGNFIIFSQKTSYKKDD